MAPKANKETLDDLSLRPKVEWLAVNRDNNRVNAEIYNELYLPSLEYIKGLEAFNDWDNPKAFKIQQDSEAGLSGFMEPYNDKDCLIALESAGKYICAIPFPVLHPTYTPMPGVQLCKSQILSAVDDDDLTLQTFPMQEVAVTSDEVQRQDFGSLTCISPEEVRIAMILNFVRRHKAGDLDEQAIQTFRRNLYSVPTQIVKEDSTERRFFLAMKTRRAGQRHAKLTRRSASQTVSEVFAFWEHYNPGGKMTIQKVMDVYRKHIPDVEKDKEEGMSADMIQKAMSIQKNVKDHKELADILHRADEELQHNSPFATITNLNAVCSRTNSVEERHFVMELMLDYNLLHPRQWTIRALAPTNDKGIINIMTAKKTLKAQLVEKLIEDINLPAKEKQDFRDCLESPVSMRRRLGFKHGPRKMEKPDKTAEFLTGSTVAGEKAFKLALKWIYEDVMDDTILKCIQEGKNAREIIQSTQLAEQIAAVAKEAEALNIEAPEEDSGKKDLSEYEKEDSEAEDGDGNNSSDDAGASTPDAKNGAKTNNKEDVGYYLCSTPNGTEIYSKGLDTTLCRQIKEAMEECKHSIKRDCTFIVTPKDSSEDEIADLIRECPSISNNADKRTAIIYEVGTSGEATTNPSRNRPSFRKQHYEKLIRGCLNSRCPKGEKATGISSKDIFYVFDCDRPGNHNAMAAPFTLSNRSKMPMAIPKSLLCVYEENSVQERAKRTRDCIAPCRAMEHQSIVVFSKDEFGRDLERRKRKIYPGTNRSSNIGFVQVYSPWDVSEYRATPEQKGKIISVENQIAPSGNNNVSLDKDPGFQSQEGKPEPVFWYTVPDKLASEICHSYNVERIIHLTAGNGCFALAGVLTRTPGIYFCLTEEHKKTLMWHLVNELFRRRQNQADHAVYDANVVQLVEKALKMKEKESSTPPKTQQAKTKAESKDGEPPKKKAKVAKEVTEQDGEPPSKKAKTAKKAKATKTKKKPVDADEDAESDDSWISDDTEEEVE